MRAYRFTQAVVAVLALAGLAGLVVWFASTALQTATPTAEPARHVATNGKKCADAGCHAPGSAATQSPHKAGSTYQGPCEQCHIITSWASVQYTHSEPTMNQGLHTVIGCDRCHPAEKPLTSANCEDCHKTPHARPSFSCTNCHLPSGWSAVMPAPAGHLSLEGGHATVSCLKCHNNPRHLPASRCVDCHGANHGGLVDCENCHDPKALWNPIKFNHDRVFRLVGKHMFVTCIKCHPGKLYAKARPACSTCHSIVHPGFTNCQDCHTPYGFTPSTFVHSRVFRLTGFHTRLECSRCHRSSLDFRGINGTDCVDCHGAHHGGLTQCQDCHTTSSFTPSTFEHSSVFALTGAHRELRCSRCHEDNEFANVPGTHCVDCHGAHHGGLTQCQDCHTTSSFTKTTFEHSRVFPLTGKHVGLKCSKCHPNDQYGVVAGTNCYDCHGKQHGGRTDCTRCHNTSGFANINPSFVHTTSFPLNGAHAHVACTTCHPTLVFSAASPACASCHTAPHVGPTDCQRCHNTVSFANVNFTHPTLAFHPTSLGVNQVCTNCHPSGNFTTYVCTPCHTDGRTYPPPGY